MKRNKLATLAIVLVVVVLAVVGVWYYQAQAPYDSSTASQSTNALTLPAATINVPYSTNLGGVGANEDATTSGQLPPGLSVGPVPLPCPIQPQQKPQTACGGFRIFGTPTQAGTYSFSLGLTTNGTHSDQSFSLQVR